jgi:hypothetical protein
MTPVSWLLVLLGAALLAFFAAGLDLLEFLRRTQIIQEMVHLRQFKEMVRRQMYISLGQLLLLWGAFFFGLYAMLTGQLRGTLFLALLLVVASLFVTARWVRGLREQARSLPAADKGLEGLYQAVGHVWQQKHLPDF